MISLRWRKEYPTTNNGMQNGSSVGIYTHCMHVFGAFGADSYARSLPINKIYASELRRKLLSRVHCWLGRRRSFHHHVFLVFSKRWKEGRIPGVPPSLSSPDEEEGGGLTHLTPPPTPSSPIAPETVDSNREGKTKVWHWLVSNSKLPSPSPF